MNAQIFHGTGKSKELAVLASQWIDICVCSDICIYKVEHVWSFKQSRKHKTWSPLYMHDIYISKNYLIQILTSAGRLVAKWRSTLYYLTLRGIYMLATSGDYCCICSGDHPIVIVSELWKTVSDKRYSVVDLNYYEMFSMCTVNKCDENRTHAK